MALAVLHRPAVIFYNRSPRPRAASMASLQFVVGLHVQACGRCMFPLIDCAHMTTQTKDLCQAIVLSDSQFRPSFVQDSQPMSEMAPHSEVSVSDFVDVPVVPIQQTNAAVAATTKAKKDDFPSTPDVEVIDPVEKPFNNPFDPVHDRKRERGGLMEEEINVFCSMTKAVKEVAIAIRECKPLHVRPNLYGVVAPRDYNSWEEASAQVASYSSSSHRGFKTMHAAEQAYSD
ncbi:Acetyl-coenzyme A synthetase [Hordeum vulgare]|nr:Acetyl-coenzyme A synthetase [Hordeum vulgare]